MRTQREKKAFSRTHSRTHNKNPGGALKTWASPPPERERVETREEWLRRSSQLVLPLVRQVAAWQGVVSHCSSPPAVSCSWLPGRRTAALSLSVERPAGGWDISISPVIGRGQEAHGLASADADGAVLAHLLHELVHCVIGSDKHQGVWPNLAAAVGLCPPWVVPQLSGDMRQQLRQQVLLRIGSYPHSSVSLPERVGGGGNRQRKFVCAHCGRIVRAAGDLRAQHLCDDGRVGGFVRV